MHSLDITSGTINEIKTTTNEIKSTSNETHKIVRTINEKPSEMNGDVAVKVNELVTQTLSSQTESFASILKQQKNDQRQNIVVKRRLERNEATKPASTRPKEIPAAKTGKRTGNVGLAVAPAPIRKPKQVKPEFNKALHVSQLDKSVTLEQITDFIATNASLEPNTDFKCTLLVKKGQDLSKLSFISYKVDVIEEKCAALFEEEFWDEGVQIRPFVPSTTLGDFIVAPTRHQPKKLKPSDDSNNENKTEQQNVNAKNEMMQVDTATSSSNTEDNDQLITID